jgi:hypothetical protein
MRIENGGIKGDPGPIMKAEIVRRLHTPWLCRTEPAIDALMHEVTHVIFRLRSGWKTTPAVELGIRSVLKVYVTFP